MALTTTDYRGNKIRLIQKKWQSLSVAMNIEKYEQPDAEAAHQMLQKAIATGDEFYSANNLGKIYGAE